MSKFKKGHHIGRPKGSKDKSYLTLQYWYDELMKDWDKIRPAQRAKLSMQLMQMLTNKIKNLPGSPEESVMNAQAAQEMLAQLEAPKNVQDGDKAPNPPLPLNVDQSALLNVKPGNPVPPVEPV